MMRLIFGAVLGLLATCSPLLALLLAVVTQPAVIAFAAGVLLWPRIARTVRRWAQ
ncbi:hypothetical protein [Streptomyces sp. NPDC002265]|uniref:hypothetical protein n=1 Tax=Streptomyces sp. NPDC002265 TaxID=3154415 RepID=UPI00332CFB11